MADYNYADVPMNIKITNNSKIKELKDPGALLTNSTRVMVLLKPDSQSPDALVLRPGEQFCRIPGDEEHVIVKRAYSTGTKIIQFFATNVFHALAPGDTMTVTAKYSAAAAFYFSYADDPDITVEKAE